MKNVFVVCMALAFYKSNAQNNQIKLYIQQIAANKVYIEYLQKGYSIVKNGLNTIGDIKNGHYKLDTDFFDGLEQVNPKIRHYAKVADIASLSIEITKRTKSLLRETRSSDLFAKRDVTYVEKVVDALLSGLSEMVDELATILIASEFKMGDDERIKRIDALYAQMRESYAFANSFYSELQLIRLQKSKDLSDSRLLQGLFHK